MTDENTLRNEKLEQLMELAVSGDKDAAQVFLDLFLAGPLFVPERHQPSPIAGAPKYPNDFAWLLGVQDGDRVIVPVFTDAQLIEEWAAAPLTFRTVPGKAILDAMPEEWWLWLNPGSDVEKEFSPWEIGELKLGPSSFATVLAEIFPEEIVEPLTLTQVDTNSYLELKRALIEFAEQDPRIVKLFILQEEGKDFEGELRTQLLVGVEAGVKSSNEVDQLRDAIDAHAAPTQIGGETLKILVGKDVTDGLYLSIFKDSQPFFTRKPKSLGSKIASALGSALKAKSH